MREHGFVLGGEQSGHIIMSDYATTGDGLLTTLHAMQLMAGGRSLRDLASIVTRLPQVLVNVPGVDQGRTDDAELTAAVDAEQERLGDGGRILLRPSGTEPLVRVMVEAATSEEATAVAERLADVVRRRLTV
jgi:phosphoglucosamine mutase